MAEKQQAKAPYETDPTGAFEQVAALRVQIKNAKRRLDERRAAANEANSEYKKLNEQLYTLIDDQSDTRPNLFSHVHVPAAAGPQPTIDLAKTNIADVKTFTESDRKTMADWGLVTMADLSQFRLDGGLTKNGNKEQVKRIEKAAQEFLSAHAGGTEATPAPKKRKAKK